MDIQRDRLSRKLRSELGATVLAALDDPEVVEVVLNPDGRLWIERLGAGMAPAGGMSAPNATALLGTVAHSLGAEITRDSPIVEGELVLDGSRFEGLIPPAVAGPAFAIRKRAGAVIPLERYVADGILSPAQAARIRAAVDARENIVIAGGTGSGKTTFANAVLADVSERHPGDRLVVVEDTPEIRCAAPNAVSLRTSAAVSMTRLLRATMRLRPDRIVVGEVRGAEALDLLKAWNTGHPGGIGTLHANDGMGALSRLEMLVAEAGLDARAARPLIAQAVDLVAVMARAPAGRRVTELLEVRGWSGGGYVAAQAAANGGSRPAPDAEVDVEAEEKA